MVPAVLSPLPSPNGGNVLTLRPPREFQLLSSEAAFMLSVTRLAEPSTHFSLVAFPKW